VPVKAILQSNDKDCGPVCLQMIFEFYGLSFSIDKIREMCLAGDKGASLEEMQNTLRTAGFDTLVLYTDTGFLTQHVNPPGILFYENTKHFVIFEGSDEQGILIVDPVAGRRRYPIHLFEQSWINSHNSKGIVMIIEYAGSAKQQQYQL
jgi:ABC-type bacteriocin/lantibiotic exporter with double-glycine peptidase domain